MLSRLKASHVFLIILVFSAATLGAALISQYGFGLKPCELCLFQRYPYVVLIMVAGLGLTRNKPVMRIRLILLCGILFLIGTGLGGYHAGVEKKIFAGPSACVSQPSDHPLSIEELKAQIMGAPMVACNEPAWQWHGITMAGINAVWSLMMAGFTFMQYARLRKVQHV